MKLALTVLGTSLVLAGCATGPKGNHHDVHHPPSTAAAPAPAQMDSMMRSMQEMHDAMMAAKTPEERARLMQEHMKLMHDGMGIMGRMRGGWGPGGGKGGMGMGAGGMAMSPEMMGRRMDMMEMMMQMMMDREAAKPPAAR
jgi:outer membrane murein-binding lipoprotein Lpp